MNLSAAIIGGFNKEVLIVLWTEALYNSKNKPLQFDKGIKN